MMSSRIQVIFTKHHSNYLKTVSLSFCLQTKSSFVLMTCMFPLVEPYVWLRSVDAADSRHPSMLVCSAYNFYPKQIKLTWLRDGKQTTTDVTSTEELPNGNWLYQIHSYLEYTPTPEEKISCMVQHATLMKPLIYDWGKRVFNATCI